MRRKREARRAQRGTRIQAAASRRREFEPQALRDLVGYQLRRTHAAIFQVFTGIMARKGVAPGNYSLLSFIHLHPDQTQSWLANACGLDRSTVVPGLQLLERRGLIQRIRNPDDKRAYKLRSTADGARVVYALGPKIQAYENHITRAFTSAECRQLVALLRRLEAAA